MPVPSHPDLAILVTEPDYDVAWMSLVLSPSAADERSLPVPAFSLDDASAHGVEPDLPTSSFRLQFLRAWIAARDGRPAEAPGHA
jgi:hypothetical protein